MYHDWLARVRVLAPRWGMLGWSLHTHTISIHSYYIYICRYMCIHNLTLVPVGGHSQESTWSMGTLEPSHQLTLSWFLRSVPSAVVRPKNGPQPFGLSAPLKNVDQHSITQVSFFICAPSVHEEDHLFFVVANARANFLGAQHFLRSLAPNCSLLQPCRQQVTHRQSQPSKYLRTDG